MARPREWIETIAGIFSLVDVIWVIVLGGAVLVGGTVGVVSRSCAPKLEAPVSSEVPR